MRAGEESLRSFLGPIFISEHDWAGRFSIGSLWAYMGPRRCAWEDGTGPAGGMIDARKAMDGSAAYGRDVFHRGVRAARPFDGIVSDLDGD
jgi:hypothetical protein